MPRSLRPLALLASTSLLVLAGFVTRPDAAPPGPHAEGPPARATVLAVLAFENNTGQTRYDVLGKGLANMMTSDLTAVPQLQLVEREQLQALIDELALQQTAYFDSTTALQVGMFVGAEYVVIGSVAAVSPEVRLDTRIVRIETAEVVQAASVVGQENALFDLQQRLADELIAGIDVVLSPQERDALRAQQEANRIDNVETMLLYSEALDALDREDYVRAIELLNRVREDAPASQATQAAMELAQERAQDRLEDEARGRLNRLIRGL